MKKDLTRKEQADVRGGGVVTGMVSGGGGKTASAPDVCIPPTSSSPTPIPYPNIATSSSLQSDAKITTKTTSSDSEKESNSDD